MTILLSLLPIVLLGHGIENLVAVAVVLLFSFMLGYRFPQKGSDTISAMILGAVLIFLGMLETTGYRVPFLFIILLASSFYFLSAPRIEISQKILNVLNLSLLAYMLYFCLVNTELAFGARTIGGFADNSLLGRFAFNFGFGSPARAAVILFALFVLNLKQSQTRFKIFFLIVFFALILLTLNRLTILFTIIILIVRYTPIKLTTPLYFYVSLFLVCISIALPDYFPLVERLERMIAVINFHQNNASFQYILFVDSGQAPFSVQRSADLILTIAAVNLGILGIILYLVYLIAVLLWTKNNADALLMVYFILISFKNFSFTYDVVSITLFLIAKLRVASSRQNLNSIYTQQNHQKAIERHEIIR